MFALPDVFHFLANELTRLSGRRFAFALIFACSFDGFFWHDKVVSLLELCMDVTKTVVDPKSLLGTAKALSVREKRQDEKCSLWGRYGRS